MNNGKNEKSFYTVKELAALLEVTEMTIYRMTRRGEIPVHNIGRSKRFSKADIDAFLERCRNVSGRRG